MSEITNFISNLPEDVSTHIFLKLPAKSLITCTCVCRSWKTFISSHLKRANDSHLCLLQRCTLPMKTGRDSFFLYSKDRDFSIRESIHFPYKDKYGFQVVASCNGLICLMNGKNHSSCWPISLNLWNPFIRKAVILHEYRNLSGLEAVGLGFDSRTSDYKLVTVQEELGNGITLKVEVYSLKTNSWKRLPDVEAKYDKWDSVYRPITYLNGAFYFVATRKKCRSFILGFDLSEEVYHEIMLPDCMIDGDIEFGFDGEGNARFNLFTWGESLAVLWIRVAWMEIWVMKEIGVKESWTQLSTIRLEAKPNSFTGLVLTKEAHVLLSFGSYFDNNGRMFLHDLKSQETWEFINDRKDTYMFLGGYVESLALLDKGNDFSTHFEIDSGDAAAAADDDDTSRTSSSGNADLLLGAFASTYATSAGNAFDFLNENNVSLDESIADLEGGSDSSAGNSRRDLLTSSISHATYKLSGKESDTSNGLSTSEL